MMYVALFKSRVELADLDCLLLDWGKSLRAKLERLTNRQEGFHASASAPSPDQKDMGPGNRGPSVHSVSDSPETATARAEDRAPAVGQNKKRWMLAVGNGVEPSTARVVDLEKRPAGVKRHL
jgi:hypothetical protein